MIFLNMIMIVLQNFFLTHPEMKKKMIYLKEQTMMIIYLMKIIIIPIMKISEI